METGAQELGIPGSLRALPEKRGGGRLSFLVDPPGARPWPSRAPQMLGSTSCLNLLLPVHPKMSLLQSEVTGEARQ